MQANKDEAARQLANAHYGLEDGIQEIYRVAGANENDPNEPIKLLEVNLRTIPSGIMPVYFGPGAAVPYSSIIIDLTPSEFEQVCKGQLSLPHGWKLQQRIERQTSNN
ncbi:MAG TPA: hypothetical protein VM008_18175 [Phycisphaerae bacterium]|nr:hypothetical protein [Phycisphaerae bacterium]